MSEHISKEEQRLRFVHVIMTSLEENPDWFHDAISAVSAGMNNALQKANERCAQYDLAFRCALSLAEPKRLSQDTKDLLNSKIVEVIGANASKVEKDFLARTPLTNNTGGRDG